jgi:uncharacterized coiled-coil protein SlyX
LLYNRDGSIVSNQNNTLSRSSSSDFSIHRPFGNRNTVLSSSSADNVRIQTVSPASEKFEDLSTDKLYEFLLAHDQNLKPVAEKLKNEQVTGSDLMNFGEDDYQSFSFTYGQKKQLKRLIKEKQLGSTSTSTISTRRELDLSQMQNELNRRQSIIQDLQQQIEQKNKRIEQLENTVEKQDKQIQQLESTVKNLQRAIDKQNQQIFTLMRLMNQQRRPPPTNVFTQQSPTVRHQLTNISAITRKLPIVPPGSPAQNIPVIQPGAPTIFQLSNSTAHVPTRPTSLPTSSVGPNSSNVTFPAFFHSQHEALAIQPSIPDPYNINNYGTYKVTIYSEDSQYIIAETMIGVAPEITISVPKQFIVRDSINNLIVNGIVTLKLFEQSAVAFNGTTDQNGTVNLPDTLADGAYEVEIYSPNKQNLQKQKFFMVVYQNRRQERATEFLTRSNLTANEIEIVLKWAAVPRDLDSHLYSSDGKHIYFSHKTEEKMSLDVDITTGIGPETTRFTVQPNLKYIYAVHRYSDEPMLTKSKAELKFAFNMQTTQINKVGTHDKLINGEIYKIPEITHPEARFWIVCMIDGSTKQIKFFENVFEDHNNFQTNEIGVKYYTG